MFTIVFLKIDVVVVICGDERIHSFKQTSRLYVVTIATRDKTVWLRNVSPQKQTLARNLIILFN